MLLKKLLWLIATGVLLCLAAMPAHSAPVFYTDPTQWSNASTGLTTITFDPFWNPDTLSNLTPGGQYQTTSSSGIAVGLVSFIGMANGGQFYTYVDDPAPGSGLDWGNGNVLQATQAVYGGVIHITLPSGVTSASTDLMAVTSGYNKTFTTFTIAVTTTDDTTTTTVSTSASARTFIGVTSPVTIRSIDLTPQGGAIYPLIDNFSYGSMNDPTPETPEPLTALLIGSGLLFLLGGRRYAQRRGLLASA